jgi:glycosyltransferase involved in cell wall biosynthesis
LDAPNAIAEKLELFVFTYNRAKSLERLLGAFSKSPFQACRITVLDNCSTDRTPLVVAESAPLFRELRHVRHPKNIGGLANYLRAIELANAEYTWVICDDDSYEFDCDDLIERLARGAFDVFSVGLKPHQTPGNYAGSLRELAAKAPFFFEHSLVSALIFRTSLYTSELIRKAYDNIPTMFPQFPFLASLVERNVSIYTCRKKMITAGVNLGYSGFAYLRGWLESVNNIEDRAVRGFAYRDVFRGSPFWHILLFSILIERTNRPTRYRRDYNRLLGVALKTGPISACKVLSVLPFVYMPGFAHKMLWKQYAKYRAAKGKPLPNFDEDR